MDTVKLIARNGAAVRHAIEPGDIVHMETASKELADAFLRRIPNPPPATPLDQPTQPFSSLVARVAR